jgi:hypothetical protein
MPPPRYFRSSKNKSPGAPGSHSFLQIHTISISMRKTILTLVILSGLAFSATSQVISQFTWSANPVTQAAVGPNGTTVSASASSSAGGSTGNGLNAGTSSTNINLTIPGTLFSIPGIDVSIDFQKEENGASFFQLGNLDFGISGGAIYANLPLTTGQVNTNNVETVPATGWHTYRFVFNNNNGVFTAARDGTVYYTASYPGATLTYTGSPNVVVGALMDGSNSNVAELDNLIVQVPPAVLALTLTSFDALNTGASNRLDWSAAQDAELRGYTIERSGDGNQFSAIATISPAQGESTHTYTYTDNSPVAISYYRLEMTDIDGTVSYSPVKRISLASTTGVSVTCYPNPVVDFVWLHFDQALAANYHYSVYTADGRLFQTGVFAISGAGQQAGINLGNAPRGILFIRLDSDVTAATTLEVLK